MRVRVTCGAAVSMERAGDGRRGGSYGLREEGGEQGEVAMGLREGGGRRRGVLWG